MKKRRNNICVYYSGCKKKSLGHADIPLFSFSHCVVNIFADKHTHNRMLTPPCFPVGMVVFGCLVVLVSTRCTV